MAIHCKNCDKELTEGASSCSSCGCVSRNYKIECKPAIYKVIFCPSRWRQKRPGLGVIKEGINRPFKESADPKLTEGVSEIYWKDKILKMWHHIVRDLRTGEIIHDEHMPLEDKK